MESRPDGRCPVIRKDAPLLFNSLTMLSINSIPSSSNSLGVKGEIGGDFKTRKLEAIKVKGKRKPVEIFKVLT